MSATPPMTAPYLIEVNARMHGHRPAVVCEDDRLSWSDLDAGVNQAANTLISLGLERGDKVVLVMDTSLAMMTMVFGVMRAGGVVVPLNPTQPQDALTYMINKLSHARLFCDEALVGLVEDMRPDLSGISADGYFSFGKPVEGWRSVDSLLPVASTVAPNVAVSATDTSDITFTSGTTGRPKGIELAHQARFNYGFGVAQSLHMDRHSVAICTTPLYTNGSWVLMLPALLQAGTVVLMKQFEPNRFLELVSRERCTHVYLLPFQATLVAECQAADVVDGASVLRILSGGAMLPDKIYARLLEVFPNVEVHLLYGQSEGFTTIAGPKDFALGKQGSMGMALFGADLRLIDEEDNDLGIGAEGEIVFHGPGMMKGYFEDPEKTAELIWNGPNGRTYFRTGDFARIDEDGYLFFLGRAQDVIRYKGEALFASQIEHVLSRHPDINEVCVCGIQDGSDGHMPVAFVIPREGASIDPVEVLNWSIAEAQGKPVAVEIVVRTEFPRGVLDKVLKKDLAATYVRDAATV